MDRSSARPTPPPLPPRNTESYRSALETLHTSLAEKPTTKVSDQISPSSLKVDSRAARAALEQNRLTAGAPIEVAEAPQPSHNSRRDSAQVSSFESKVDIHSYTSPISEVPPFLYAVISKDKSAVHAFIQSENFNINQTTESGNKHIASGRTALHFAVESNNLELVKLLLEAGIKADSHDKRGLNALHLAATHKPIKFKEINDSKEIIKLLVENGLDINSRDKKGRTPLMYAARSQNEKALEYLLALGADRSLKDNNGSTALDVASEMVIRT